MRINTLAVSLVVATSLAIGGLGVYLISAVQDLAKPNRFEVVE